MYCWSHEQVRCYALAVCAVFKSWIPQSKRMRSWIYSIHVTQSMMSLQKGLEKLTRPTSYISEYHINCLNSGDQYKRSKKKKEMFTSFYCLLSSCFQCIRYFSIYFQDCFPKNMKKMSLVRKNGSSI